MAASEDAKDFLLAVYDRNAKMNEVFIEWRHKMLLYGTSAIALMIAAVEYLRTADHRLSWIPGVAGALFGTCIVLSDIRARRILHVIYARGACLENDMSTKGFYREYAELEDGQITYAKVIRGLGGLLGALALLLGLVFTFT